MYLHPAYPLKENTMAMMPQVGKRAKPPSRCATFRKMCSKNAILVYFHLNLSGTTYSKVKINQIDILYGHV